MGNYDDFWAQTPAQPSPPAAPTVVAGATGTVAPALPSAALPAAAPTWQPQQPAWQPGQPWAGPPLTQSRMRSPSRFLRYGAQLVALFLLFGVGSAAYRKFQVMRPLTTPPQVGGFDRLDGAAYDEITDTMKADLRADGADRAVSAVYGAGGVPQIILGAGSDHAYDSLEAAADQAFVAFGAAGALVDQSSVATLDDGHGGLVRCATMSGVVPGSACVWRTGRTVGMLVRFGGTDVAEAAALTGEARATVEG